MSAPHHPPEPWDDGRCRACVEERVAAYAAKHPTWSVEERRKYARFKCPCKNQPCKLEPWWVHWLTAVLLLALVAAALYALFR